MNWFVNIIQSGFHGISDLDQCRGHKFEAFMRPMLIWMIWIKILIRFRAQIMSLVGSGLIHGGVWSPAGIWRQVAEQREKSSRGTLSAATWKICMKLKIYSFKKARFQWLSQNSDFMSWISAKLFRSLNQTQGRFNEMVRKSSLNHCQNLGIF